MASFNKVIVAGNLTRDPELRYTPKGTAIVKCSLAINRTWQSEAGEKKEEVTFVDFTAWGRLAEVLAQYCRKGSALLLEGRLNLQQWDDRATGQKRQKLEVVAEAFQFLDGKPKSDSAEDGAEYPPRTPMAAREAARKESATDDGPPPESDDVPF